MPNTESSLLTTGGIPEVTMEVEVYGTTQTPVDATLSISEMAADAAATGAAIAAVAEDVTELAADVAAILGTTYPVGSIYMTIEDSVPEDMPGTWTEILIPLTWGDATSGTRSYSAGTGTGTVHFFLRTA